MVLRKNKYEMKEEEPKTKEVLLYGVKEIPPWYLTMLLSVQQFLTCFGAVFSYPMLVSKDLCIASDVVGLSELINTVIFVCGLSSLLQSTFGIRLPIIQGASYNFATPVKVMMSDSNCTHWNGMPIVDGSSEHRELWQENLSKVSGGLIVASVFQVLVGFTGAIGFMIRYVGPLTIAPTITLIGLSLFSAASYRGSQHWWICFTTIFLITVFSQYLRNVSIPFFKGTRLKIFGLFPVLMGLVISWIICLILTETDVLPDDKDKWGYFARTDVRSEVLDKTKWFRFPYPGQWGVPIVTLSGVFGMMAAALTSMIESVGDYYACARLCGVSSPPGSAVSRGIGMEGIACILAAAWGTAGGNTSYSENIGAIGITKVGSRLVIQIAGIIMMILGCVGKFGALFVMLPDPVVGGLFYVMFGMVTAVGVSNLQFVDLNSTRNLFIFGFSVFFGFSVPNWALSYKFDVGDDTVNQILDILCQTNMLVGGVVAFVLDNTIPGTRKERGLLNWGKAAAQDDEEEEDWSIYDLPLIQSYLNKLKYSKYVPFLSGFVGDRKNKPETIITGQQYEDNKECYDMNEIPSNGVENEAYETDIREAKP